MTNRIPIGRGLRRAAPRFKTLAAGAVLMSGVFGLTGAAHADTADIMPEKDLPEIETTWLDLLVLKYGLDASRDISDAAPAAVPDMDLEPMTLTSEQRTYLDIPVAAVKGSAVHFPIAEALGLSGDMEMARVETDYTAGLGVPVRDNIVGAANVTWHMTRALDFSAGVRRGLADTPTADLAPILEDRVEGGVRYAVTERLALSAWGSMVTSRAFGDGAIPTLRATEDEAEFNADYFITPRIAGGLNYTYESFEGAEGKLSNESTVFLTLKGKF